MAETTLQSGQSTTEKTFRSYNSEQGKAYAKVRRNYHRSVYEAVLSHHGSSGGQFDTCVDIGCGPGFVTLTLAAHFTDAIGLDPSEGMINTARSFGGITSASNAIHFEISTAEELGSNLTPPISESSVDLITAANAAHWFNMSGFWPSAARILKPGGTVALWGSGDIRVHPDMPNGAAIQVAIEQYQERHMLPHYEPGNRIVRNQYLDLPLPWDLEHPVLEFDKNSFVRKQWTVNESFFEGETEATLDIWEKMMETSSPRTRWRQANPDVADTERDPLKILRKELERLLHETGVEPGKEKVKGIALGVLLMFKKKAKSTA